jgi:hypothetical protein
MPDGIGMIGLSGRLSAEIQRLVESWMIDESIIAFKAGMRHNFAESTDYDLLLPSGDRLPPKAIFGIALEQVIGRPARCGTSTGCPG